MAKQNTVMSIAVVVLLGSLCACGPKSDPAKEEEIRVAAIRASEANSIPELKKAVGAIDAYMQAYPKAERIEGMRAGRDVLLGGIAELETVENVRTMFQDGRFADAEAFLKKDTALDESAKKKLWNQQVYYPAYWAPKVANSFLDESAHGPARKFGFKIVWQLGAGGMREQCLIGMTTIAGWRERCDLFDKMKKALSDDARIDAVVRLVWSQNAVLARGRDEAVSALGVDPISYWIKGSNCRDLTNGFGDEIRRQCALSGFAFQ